MGDEIRINKTVLMVLIGFLLTVAFASFMFLPGKGKDGNIVVPDKSNAGNTQAYSPANGDIQEVYLKAFAGGYDKYEISVKKGIPVRLHFTAENAGCGSYLVIYGLGVTAISKNNQEAVVEFTPDKEGTYTYTCGMRMFPPGKFVVTA